jgi:hypothetical protein
MRASATGQTGSEAQLAVAKQFARLGWGVAPNPQEHDVGTDLWLMARDARLFDLGALAGSQVKSGDTAFDSPGRDDSGREGWWFYDSTEHFKYWTQHRVPHILVLHELDTGASYWTHVTEERVVPTRKRAKIFVPRDCTIDDEHINELLEVATGDDQHPGWEGSAWSRRMIPRQDQLRYALLTPRLIAPHPNLAVDELSQAEAVACLVEMRLRGLRPSPFPWERLKTPPLDDCRTSQDWWWRFYAALYDVMVDGADISAITDLLNINGIKAFEQAAAAAMGAAIFMERGLPAESRNVVTPIIEADKCEPVDHAWLSMLSARSLAEAGELDAARTAAIEIQGLRNTVRNDPTAMAIVGAAAGLIISTSLAQSAAGFPGLSNFIAGRDTMAAWWRTEEVASGLQHQADDDFRNWANDSSTVIGREDQAYISLRSASLIAGVTGDHTAWRSDYSKLARRILMTSPPDEQSEISSALDAMRLAGDSRGIELAISHLTRVGPVAAVKASANRIDLEHSTRTSLYSGIKFVEHAADVLDDEDADRHARWAIRTLNDPVALNDRLAPTFDIPIAVLDMLSAIVPVMSSAGRRTVIEHLTALDAQGDFAVANGYASVLLRIPRKDWGAVDLEQLAERDSDDDVLADAITALVAPTDPATRQSLETKIAQGDLNALAAYGPVADLPAEVVAALRQNLTQKIAEHISRLPNGATSPAYDFAGVLAAVNVERPDDANWEPVLDLLATSSPFTEHLHLVLRRIRRIAPRIPADVVDRLEPVLRSLMTSRAILFPGNTHVRGSAAAALAAVRPDAIADTDLWALLDGDGDERAAGALVIASKRQPGHLAALAAVGSDTDPKVRSFVANCLAYWVTHDVEVDSSLLLLTRFLGGEGTEVTRMVAQVIDGVPTSRAVRQVAALLREDPSAYVGMVCAQHEGDPDTTPPSAQV